MPSIVRERSTADELSAKADELIAEAKIAMRQPFKGRRNPRKVSNVMPQAGRDDAALSYCMGSVLGRKFMHDPFALAKELGIRVLPRVALEDMTTDPEMTVYGRAFSVGDGFIQLGAELSPRDERVVMAHEVGHIVGFADEEHANIFASAFVELYDPDHFKYFANRLAIASQ